MTEEAVTNQSTQLVSITCAPIWILDPSADQRPVHHADADAGNTGNRTVPQRACDAVNHAIGLSAPVVGW